MRTLLCSHTFIFFSRLNYAHDVNNKELGVLGSHIIWVNVIDSTPKSERHRRTQD